MTVYDKKTIVFNTDWTFGTTESLNNKLIFLIGMMVRVFANRLRKPGFNPTSSHTKDLKKWYLMPPCLTLSIIRYGSRVKWSNPRKGVAPSLTLRCSSYQKGSLQVILDCGHQFYLLYLSFWKLNISSAVALYYKSY